MTILKTPMCVLYSTWSHLVYATRPTLKRSKNDHLLYISLLLLLRSSDCELNPGSHTPKYPCQVCSKACGWGQRASACDNYDQWYYANCLEIDTSVFNYHPHSNVSWICCSWGLPNFSTSIFDWFVVDTSNPHDSLGTTNNTSMGSTSEPGSPLHTSSPKKGPPTLAKSNTNSK
jgi:hypothetical protein